jgi:hypothetical protein
MRASVWYTVYERARLPLVPVIDRYDGSMQVDWATTASGAGVVVSLVGTGIAIWQARLARRAAEVAGKASDASAAQALAAIEQANLFRRQLANDAAARHQRDAPEFHLRMQGVGEWGAWHTSRDGNRQFVSIAKNNKPSLTDWFKRRTLVLTYARGPAAEVTITLDPAASADSTVFESERLSLVEGATARCVLITSHRLEGTEVRLEISSRELGGDGRVWTEDRSVSL